MCAKVWSCVRILFFQQFIWLVGSWTNVYAQILTDKNKPRDKYIKLD